jgi:hypothetical protein
VRVKTKPRLSKNERQSGRGLHGACDLIIIVEEPCSSVGEGIVQVNIDGVKAAQRLRRGEASVEVLLEHVAGIIPVQMVTYFQCGMVKHTHLERRQWGLSPTASHVSPSCCRRGGTVPLILNQVRSARVGSLVTRRRLPR